MIAQSTSPSFFFFFFLLSHSFVGTMDSDEEWCDEEWTIQDVDEGETQSGIIMNEDPMADVLLHAAWRGNKKEAQRILSDNGALVNCTDHYGQTPLHLACTYGNNEIVSLLLAQPGVEVNVKTDIVKRTPFNISCDTGKSACALLLLGDSRVDLYEPDKDGYPPLDGVVVRGRLDVLKSWIVTGRQLIPTGKEGYWDKVIKNAKGTGNFELISLLERFRDDPEKIRNQVRAEVATDFFALVIFLCDGLLAFKKCEPNRLSQFFGIASRLPIELQMILCHRAVGSAADNIRKPQREAAFKRLALVLPR